MARKLLKPLILLHFAAVVALLFCLVSGKRIRSSTIDQDALLNCPLECDCEDYTLYCSHRGLQTIPHPLPKEVKKL